MRYEGAVTDVPTLITKKAVTRTPPRRQAPAWLLPFIERAYLFLREFLFEEQKVEIKKTPMETESVVSAIQTHAENVYNNAKVKPKYIIMGEDQWFKFFRDEIKEARALGFRGYDDLGDGKPVAFFLGMQIVVVPWINGLFVIPGLDELG